jgi:cyclohexanecarboxyl-CoA dehydrogenase
MEFGFTETQQLYRNQLREFVADRIIGENLTWDDGDNFPTEVLADLGDMGVIGMNLPEELDGSDLDPLTGGVVYEELGRGDVAFTMLLMVQNIANAILAKSETPEHLDIAAATARGEIILSWGLTEPDQGADAQSIETTAIRDGGKWVINGEKTAITGATFGDYILVYAREQAQDEIRVYLIPFHADGVEVDPYYGIGGRVSGWGQVYLDDVTLPEDAKISDQDGFKLAMGMFDPSRGWISLYCLGAAQQTLEETEQYLKEREAFGQSVAHFQGPQFELAEMWTKVEAARLKGYESLWRAKEGKDFTKDASMAKLFGTQLSTSVVHDCMVLHGHYGYSEDFGLGKRMQDIIGLEIGEGPNQIQKQIIAREILGREYLPY